MERPTRDGGVVIVAHSVDYASFIEPTFEPFLTSAEAYRQQRSERAEERAQCVRIVGDDGRIALPKIGLLSVVAEIELLLPSEVFRCTGVSRIVGRFICWS
jgi:hypothetical protein